MVQEPICDPELISLKETILRNIARQGFTIDSDGNLQFNGSDKDKIRKLHDDSVKYLRNKHRSFIKKVDDQYVSKFIADGCEIDPESISPIFREITTEQDAQIFRWVKLHWSIPTSAGYGRRLRYLVFDDYNQKLIGVIGLGDPVFGMKDRDATIGWNREQRSDGLRKIMDAFVLGAVPPYSSIRGGKLIAGLIAASEIQQRFKEKYSGSKSLISNREFNGQLAAITTTSALGKSVMYDRLKMYDTNKQKDGPKFIHAGWTSGSGEFPFLNGTYNDLLKLVDRSANPHLGKNEAWGTGIRNRRTVVKNALKILGLKDNLLYHGVKREIFITNLGSNWKKYLQGESEDLEPYNLSSEEISDFILNRWIIPRSKHVEDYKNYKKEEYRIINPASIY